MTLPPTIQPGTGVAAVAYHLEREFVARGATVERFTAADAGRAHRRPPRSALGARLAHGWDVIWFSTVGTGRARRFLAERPDAEDLHGDIERDRNNIRKPTALNERGEQVNGAGDQPNVHDILTGSDSHGRALLGAPQTTTCNNLTSNAEGRAMVGHHDRLGGANASWNAVHASNGCSQQNLVSTGGAGLFYCFAVI